MDVLQPLAAVLLVLGLLGMALFFLKRRGAASFNLPRLGPAGPRRLELLERLTLDAQHSLYLVRIDKKSLVLATAQSSCLTVCELPEKDVSE